MIALRGVSKRFLTEDDAEVVALRNVDLEVARGEFVAILGPSGCGKSTLLRLVAGLLPPSAGSVLVEGQPVRGPRADLGFVFQSPTLLPWASVLDNVLFPLRLLRRPRASAVPRAQALLDMVGLADVATRRPHELSGGMQQRVALCRALVHDPALLMMDEPFAALDALTRETLGRELLEIWQRSPTTVLFVTHSVPEAVLLADRVVVMGARPGHLVAEVAVDLPRPRPPGTEDGPAFAAIVARLRAMVTGRNAGAAGGLRHAVSI